MSTSNVAYDYTMKPADAAPIMQRTHGEVEVESRMQDEGLDVDLSVWAVGTTALGNPKETISTLAQRSDAHRRPTCAIRACPACGRDLEDLFDEQVVPSASSPIVGTTCPPIAGLCVKIRSFCLRRVMRV